MNTTITTLVEPIMHIDLFALGWTGQWDADQQPVDAKGRRLARNYVHIGEAGGGRSGLRIYPPRLLGNIARTAYWALYAKARHHRFWKEQVMPVVTAIHTDGGVAFARKRDDDGPNRFDVWRTRQYDHGLSYSQEMVDVTPPAQMEPLEQEAHRRVNEGLRHMNRKLGEELTRLNDRLNYGDISRCMGVTARALDWAMREKIRREIGEVSPFRGPALVRMHVDNVGEWLWRRSDDGYGWRLISSPSDVTTEIHIP